METVSNSIFSYCKLCKLMILFSQFPTSLMLLRNKVSGDWRLDPIPSWTLPSFHLWSLRVRSLWQSGKVLLPITNAGWSTLRVVFFHVTKLSSSSLQRLLVLPRCLLLTALTEYSKGHLGWSCPITVAVECEDKSKSNL